MTKTGMNRQPLLRIVLPAGLALLLAGCRPPLNPDASDGTASSPPAPARAAATDAASAWPTEAQMTEPIPTPSDPGLQGLVEMTRQDLARRLSIPGTQISFVEAAPVEWPDSSLGCPQPGMSYLQVITPGYRIVLQANDQLHEYHTNRNGYFVYCTDPLPPLLQQPEK